MDPLLITIDGHRYNMRGFLASHPGEKKEKNRSISNHANRDISTLFAEIHDSKASRRDARVYLQKARELGNFNGIVYLGPV
jgi:cytochrome b involved in lipid metabolism